MLAPCFVQANTPQFLGKANLRPLPRLLQTIQAYISICEVLSTFVR